MRKPTAVVLTALLSAFVLTGCHFSKVNANERVHVAGRALDASGTPLSGATVFLFKEADLGEFLFGTVEALSTLGTVCLLPQAPTICAKARNTRTDHDGNYSFDLTGADTQGSIGTEAVLDAVFSDPRGGSNGTTTTVSFHVRQPNVALPPAALWNSAARVSDTPQHVRLTWTPLPAGTGTGTTYAAEVYLNGQSPVAWSQPAQPPRADVDPRILEDKQATVAIRARTTLPGGSGAGTVRAAYLSPKLKANPTAGAPPSRGRPCASVSGNPPVVGGYARCGATDGDLVQPARLPAVGKQVVTGVAIDLGRARPIRLVVVRGVGSQFLVEVSSDGRTYRTIATEDSDAVAVRPPVPPPARWVRVRSASGVDVSLLREVSVW